jgi:hypothetical protein
VLAVPDAKPFEAALKAAEPMGKDILLMRQSNRRDKDENK